MSLTPKLLEPELRRLIADGGHKLRPLAKDSRMSYWKLFRWYSGRTVVLDVNSAERLYKVLTGESLLK